MRKAEMKERWSLKCVVSAVLSAALLCGLAGCGAPRAGSGADYASYGMVVTAWDTPQEVLDELAGAGVTPVDYFDGDTLLIPEEIAALGKNASVYLCEGTYEAGEGNFIVSDASVPLTIVGAGADKTVVTAGGGLRGSTGSGVVVSGGGEEVEVSGITFQGFRCGVLVEDASHVTLRDLYLTDNTYAGVRLSGAENCRLENCSLEGNGALGAGNTGYGLSMDAACKDNSGENNTYSGNANGNAVDYPSLWADYTQQNNSIGLEIENGAPVAQPVLTDPVLEAKNARPGENALRYEVEDAGYTGCSESSDGGNMENASNGKYVFLFDGSITMKIDVPEAGNYRIFVVGGSDDGNNKCDFVQVNGGDRYLTSYPGRNQGAWQLSQPGTEVWANNELVPQTPAEGFALNAGENEITITANWGYCAYDCIYIEKIDAA